jgi:predicted GNAT family N-acyltransferase
MAEPAATDIVVECFGAADRRLAAAHALRRAVFIEEQGVSEALEIDGADAECRHFLARKDGVAVGTARLRPLAGAAKIERMAVLAPERKSGVGRSLIARAEDEARRMGVAHIVLHAQTHAAPFYERLGYVREGAEFEEAGIPHVAMRKALTPPSSPRPYRA